MKYKKGLIGNMQRHFAVSEIGARNILKAIGCTIVANITNLFPVMLVYAMIKLLMQYNHITNTQILTIGAITLVFVLMMYWATNRQYKNTYSAVYAESANMRLSLAERLRKLPLSFFDRKNASDLTVRIMGDVATLENGFSHQLPQLFGAFVMLFLAMFGLIGMNWRLGLALTWVVPVSLILFVLSLRWQKRKMVNSTKVQLAANEKIEEGFTQVQTIKAMSQEDRYMAELGDQLQALEKSQMDIELVGGAVFNAIETIVRLALPTLAIVGANLYLKGAVALDELLFFLLIATTLFEPLSAVLTNGTMWTFFSTKVDRMNEIYDMPIQEGNPDFKIDRYDIGFDGVAFSYTGGDQVLDNVTFTARQGETTALIGPSGGGKSTCARLASRFWDVGKGQIRLGGLDIRLLDPEALLRYYSIIFQDVVLFNASLMDNIRIGRKDATDAEVIQAARLAQCDHFIQKLPEGYDTIIGENGSHLSGGERQRISIARAILKDAPIVIMDEATASQDAENESLIQKALSTLIQDKTVLVIAHRMRTVRNADKIVVLSGGTVIEQGAPDELIAKGGQFAKMIALQQHIESNHKNKEQ